MCPLIYRSSVETHWGVRYVVAQGDYIYSVSGPGRSFYSFDCSDPDNPVALDEIEFTSPFSPNYINPNTIRLHPNGTHALVSCGGANGDVSSRLYSVNISVPSSLSIADYTEDGLTYTASALDVQGDYAYVVDAWSGGGDDPLLAIFDISDPTNLTFLGSTDAYLNPRGVSVRGSYAFVTDYSDWSIRSFDVSNPAAPFEISSFGTNLNAPRGIKVIGRYAYIANEGDTGFLTILDVSDPSDMSFVGEIRAGVTGARDVFLKNTTAFISGYTTGYVTNVEVAKPASPTVESSTDVNLDIAMCVFVDENPIDPTSDLAFVASAHSNDSEPGSIALFDIDYLSSSSSSSSTSVSESSSSSTSLSSLSSSSISSSSQSSITTVSLSSSTSSEPEPSETTSGVSPLEVVQTVLVDSNNNELEVSNGSSNRRTNDTSFAHAFSFGTIAPGEACEPIVTFLRVPYSTAIGNVKIALIDSGGVPVQATTFGLAHSSILLPDVEPTNYFQGVNDDDLSTNSFNISVGNKRNTESEYVYLFLNLPRNSQIETGVIRYKWFFDYAG